MMTAKLDPWIEGYLDYALHVKRVAWGTIKDMRCTYKRLTQAMEKIRPGSLLWKLSLEDYVRWVGQERELGSSVQTINKQLSHLRGLLDYTWHSGRSDRNVLDGFQIQDAGSIKEPRSLNLEEARLLIAACRARTRLERRERLIVLLLYGCGLRTGELCNLDVGDVDVERQEVVIRKAKGDRQRRIPVPEAVWTALLAYLTERGGRKGPLLRTEAKHSRLNVAGVSDLVIAVAQRAGLRERVTPKALRHSFATHLMDQGVDLAVIASLMGHRSPQETGVYLHALPGKREKAVAKLQINREETP